MGLGIAVWRLGFGLKGAEGLSKFLKLCYLGFTFRPTSWTLDHWTFHTPSGPRSTLMLTSSNKWGSVPLPTLTLSLISSVNLAQTSVFLSRRSNRENRGYDCASSICLYYQNLALMAFLSCYHNHLSDQPLPSPTVMIWPSPLSVSGHFEAVWWLASQEQWLSADEIQTISTRGGATLPLGGPWPLRKKKKKSTNI